MTRTSKVSGFSGPGLMWLILASLSGCSESPQKEIPLKSAADDIKSTVDDSVEEIVDAVGPAREAFLTKLRIRLRAIDAKIEELANREQNLTETARAEWNDKVEQLVVRRDAARKRLKSLGEASEVGWSDMRDGAESAWDDLARAVDDAGTK